MRPRFTEEAAAPRPAIVHDRRTLRDGDWKLTLPRENEVSAELYNLSEDPYEQQKNVKEEPGRALTMQSKLTSLLAHLQSFSSCRGSPAHAGLMDFGAPVPCHAAHAQGHKEHKERYHAPLVERGDGVSQRYGYGIEVDGLVAETGKH